MDIQDYRAIPESVFEEDFWQVSRYVTERYKINVRLRVLPFSRTGDLDGETIVVRSDMSWEMKLFILLHLTGHTIQVNTSNVFRKIGEKRYERKQSNLTEEEIKKITWYEQTVGRYGLRILHEARIVYLNQWCSDWSNGDLVYLLEVYRTKERYLLTKEFLDRVYKNKYITYGSRPILPLEIPQFTPAGQVKRSSF